ncbi:MAG: hypothetical protein MI923_08475 [Phycisphaerales bacterium]|nr:hypothetical protein [Phycisphaerales bacterium]
MVAPNIQIPRKSANGSEKSLAGPTFCEASLKPYSRRRDKHSAAAARKQILWS